ncbi:MAG: hypothetical protein AAGJ40_18620 [Planctomycetota bacterium]
MNGPHLPTIPSTANEDVDRGAARCCSWRPSDSFGGGLLAICGVVTLISLSAAAYFAGQASSATSDSLNWRDLPIANATAAIRDDDYSMATGLISDLTEGLFVLDHNSGLLQCTVMYPRMGQFMASFSINVSDALGGAAKGGSYMMVTGTADFPRSSSRPVGASVIYVLDTGTGNYACYGIPFNRVEMNANRPQQGPLVLIATGAANPIIDRDDLR